MLKNKNKGEVVNLEYSIDIPKSLTMQEALKNVLGLLQKNYLSNHGEEIYSAKLKLSEYEEIITPDIKDAGKYVGENHIVKISLDTDNNIRLGNSALAALFSIDKIESPDVNIDSLHNLINLIDELIEKELIRAYKSVGNGGVVVALCEMAILGNCGISAHLLSYNYYNQAFNEELAIILEIDRVKYDDFMLIVYKFFCKKSHPFPDSPTSYVESKHYYFNINCFGLTQKEEIIDIWWGVGSKMNINESTQTIKEWFEK